MEKDFYKERDSLLLGLGFNCYEQYLQSKMWKRINNKIIKRCGGICEVCNKRKVVEIHNRSYCFDAIVGKSKALGYLVACCYTCINEAKYVDGKIQDFKIINQRLGKNARDKGGTLYGLCKKCKYMPVKINRDYCGRCKKPESVVLKNQNKKKSCKNKNNKYNSGLSEVMEAFRLVKLSGKFYDKYSKEFVFTYNQASHLYYCEDGRKGWAASEVAAIKKLFMKPYVSKEILDMEKDLDRIAHS